jgi:signal transduction histidine kinase
LGLSSLFIAVLNDSLTHLGVIDSIYLARPGICFFVLANSLALSQRFAQSFAEVEQLSKTLEGKNEALEKEIKTRNRLEQKIINISEEERCSISHELHDGLCQQLTGARLRAYSLALQHRDSPVGEALSEIAEQLKQSIDDAYKTARGLWPVGHEAAQAGPSLESLVQKIAKTSGIKTSFDRHCLCDTCTNPNIPTLYRIAQEAVTNADKHAKASYIHVALNCHGKDGIELIVEDDGIGQCVDHTRLSDEVSGGLGLHIMAHRAQLINAKLTISDGPQGGTLVRCIASCPIDRR